MAILNIQAGRAGVEGIFPRLVYIFTNDTLATVFTTGYLNQASALNFQFQATDIVLISTTSNPNLYNSSSVDLLQVTHTGTNWSLIEPINNAVLPTTLNHIATYLDSTGKLTEDPTTAITGGALQATTGNIIAGQSGTQGLFTSFSPGSNDGTLIFGASNNSGNFTITITNNSHAQSTSYTFSDVGSPTGSILTSKIQNADISPNLIAFDTTVTAAALAGAMQVPIGGISGTGHVYKVRELYINAGGTNFSGGGGDRGISIGDSAGFTFYSIVPAATLQALVNSRWGSTALPFSVSTALNASTVAGANIVALYNGGTTDYSTGSVVLSGLLERVT